MWYLSFPFPLLLVLLPVMKDNTSITFTTLVVIHMLYLWWVGIFYLSVRLAG